VYLARARRIPTPTVGHVRAHHFQRHLPRIVYLSSTEKEYTTTQSANQCCLRLNLSHGPTGGQCGKSHGQHNPSPPYLFDLPRTLLDIDISLMLSLSLSKHNGTQKEWKSTPQPFCHQGLHFWLRVVVFEIISYLNILNQASFQSFL
jgi:hypothetical protein